jgi:hypothetical protein
MATPPFNIAETTPQASDFQSVYPAAEQAFRDIVESWLTLISDPATGYIRTTLVDAGAAVGPVVTLFRDSASPAAVDAIGQIVFSGRDSAANTQTYATIYGSIISPTNGSENGYFIIQTVQSGTVKAAAQFTGTSMILGNGDAASLGSIYRPIGTGYTYISGGSAASAGAHILLFGESHASLPQQSYYRGSVHSFQSMAGGGGITVNIYGTLVVTG